ncbi:MAG: lipocalin-like domain-containing protein [Bacteroidaceae bacterium]|jgi:hypothetical protein|nr:lipocalin-like domain-containing protein [Bacteroidaceae bacterium]
MKIKNCIFILVAMLMIAMTSCDKWDCNGDLDGMWQLTEWRDKDNNVKATKQDMIFYSFQLQMASFRKRNGFLRTSMKASPEQIVIYDPIMYKGGGHDEILPMSELAEFGVPEDGIFWIEVLTGSSMVLKTNMQDVFTFRKY